MPSRDFVRRKAAGQGARHSLINELAEHAPSFVFVLDDFHAIHAPPILERVASLLEHAPPQMHLLLLTRVDPPLPFSDCVPVAN